MEARAGPAALSPEYENKRTLKALHEFMAQPAQYTTFFGKRLTGP